MPRIVPLEAPYPAEIQAHFDEVMPPGAPPLVLFTTVASSPRAWRKFRGGALLADSLLSLRERELVICRVCARARCEYEWGVHVTAFARAAKLTHDELAATLEVPSNVGRWSARESALIEVVDALHERATLDDAEFARLRAHFDEPQVLEVLMLAGFYRTVAYLANGLALPLESAGARFADYRPAAARDASSACAQATD
jgi:alkylhydroperoxidase family enzyme